MDIPAGSRDSSIQACSRLADESGMMPGRAAVPHAVKTLLTMLVIAVIASLALASMADMASAHVVRWATQVRIVDYADNASFVGRVRSERRACKHNRLVTVWKRNPGAMDGPVDTARTNRTGWWAVYAPGGVQVGGAYYATVRRRVLRRSAGHRHVCRAARSPIFRLSR